MYKTMFCSLSVQHMPSARLQHLLRRQTGTKYLQKSITPMIVVCINRQMLNFKILTYSFNNLNTQYLLITIDKIKLYCMVGKLRNSRKNTKM